MMFKRNLAVLALAFLTVSTASAQIGGGGGGGRGGGHGAGGGGHSGGGKPPAAGPSGAAPQAPAKPVDESMIVGVVKAIDVGAGRVTIAYEPVEARNWPAGAMPFVVENGAVLKDVAIGEKVRFKLESQQIAEIVPYVSTSPSP